MADEIANLMLKQLRHMRGTIDIVAADVSDMRLRTSAVEHHLGQVVVQVAGLNSRMDRFDERLARVERRLDLVEA